MTRKTLNILAAGLVAFSMGAVATAAPAHAGGQVSITYNPKNAKDEKALKTGLALYSLFNNVKNSGSIKQKGNNNSAGLGQNGKGNSGVIHQEGNGHNGTLQQNGNNNSYGLFQFGKNTNGNVTQNGNGRTGATVQFGW